LAAVALVGVLGVALPMQIFSSRLPEPIAVHWGADFEPDGSRAKRSAVTPPAIIIAGALLLSLIGAARAYRPGRAARLALVTFASGLAAATNATIIVRNLDKTVWSDADSQTSGMLALQIGLPFAVAALAYAIGWRAWRDVHPPAAPKGAALPLAEGARAYWTGGASNRWLLGIGVSLLTQGIVLWALLPGLRSLPVWLALLVVVFATLEFFSRIRVTVDGGGVTVRYGHLGLWTRRVPLDRIEGAHALELDAIAHGGWGYRGGLRLLGKASIVVRSGPAVRLDLRGGQQLYITVDDAATAARLVNALLERKTPAGGVAAELAP
jgi:hypothetical protein